MSDLTNEQFLARQEFSCADAGEARRNAERAQHIADSIESTIRVAPDLRIHLQPPLDRARELVADFSAQQQALSERELANAAAQEQHPTTAAAEQEGEDVTGFPGSINPDAVPSDGQVDLPPRDCQALILFQGQTGGSPVVSQAAGNSPSAGQLVRHDGFQAAGRGRGGFQAARRGRGGFNNNNNNNRGGPNAANNRRPLDERDRALIAMGQQMGAIVNQLIGVSSQLIQSGRVDKRVKKVRTKRGKKKGNDKDDDKSSNYWDEHIGRKDGGDPSGPGGGDKSSV